jgi:hypothetical protein
MDHNRPSLYDILSELGGLAFTIGFVTMAAFPFALPVLMFGLLALPLLLPVLLIGLLYAIVALPRRYFRARRERSSPSRTSTARPPTRTSVGLPGSP